MFLWDANWCFNLTWKYFLQNSHKSSSKCKKLPSQWWNLCNKVFHSHCEDTIRLITCNCAAIQGHGFGYLSPLVVLCIVGLHSVEIRLSIISAHRVQPVAQQANPHRIPGNAERRHGGPRVCLWIIPGITKFHQTKLNLFHFHLNVQVVWGLFSRKHTMCTKNIAFCEYRGLHNVVEICRRT